MTTHLSQQFSYGSTAGVAPEAEEARKWRYDAVCIDAPDDIFWPSNGDLTAARDLCAVCPVLDECFADAILTRDYGPDTVFRAGMTGWQRMNAKSGKRVLRDCKTCAGQFLTTGNAAFCSELCRARARRSATRRWRSA